jgi:hypothetical protein
MSAIEYKVQTERTRCLIRGGGIVINIRRQVTNVIPWMAIQSLLQAFLIQVMPNKADRAAQDKEPVQTPILNQLIHFLRAKGTATAKHVDKANGNAAVDIEN